MLLLGVIRRSLTPRDLGSPASRHHATTLAFTSTGGAALLASARPVAARADAWERRLCWTGATRPPVGDYRHAHPDGRIQEECFDKRVRHRTEAAFVFISRFWTDWSSCRVLIGTTPPLPL